jgi:hypothetical protein
VALEVQNPTNIYQRIDDKKIGSAEEIQSLTHPE